VLIGSRPQSWRTCARLLLRCVNQRKFLNKIFYMHARLETQLLRHRNWKNMKTTLQLDCVLNQVSHVGC